MFAEASRLVVPAIVLGEYYYGIRQSRQRMRYEEWLAQNLHFAEIQMVSETTASRYADLRIHLKTSGKIFFCKGVPRWVGAHETGAALDLAVDALAGVVLRGHDRRR